MGRAYGHLSASERNLLQSGLDKGHSQRSNALKLRRAPSTISRDIARGSFTAASYDAAAGCRGAVSRRRRGPVKLREGSALRRHVFFARPPRLVAAANIRQTQANAG